MKYSILCLVLVCYTFNTFSKNIESKTILLISPLVQMEERSLPLELDKNFQTYSEYYLATYPKSKNVENLLNEFENAQKYYLVKSFSLARQYYEKVISYRDMDEWKDIHRKIIFLSYIRLSELNSEKEDYWILEGLRFSLNIDPKKLNLTKRNLRKISDLRKSFIKDTIKWQVSQFKRDFNYILINGHIIDLKKIEVVNIPSGKFRLTFLSDIYKPQTLYVSSQQIPLLVPTRIPFLSGVCEKPFVNNEGEIPSNVALYYSKDCIKNDDSNKAIVKKVAKHENCYNCTSQKGFDGTNKADDFLTNSKPFYKKKWFLITLGILGGAVAIHAMNDKDEKPTHETVKGLKVCSKSCQMRGVRIKIDRGVLNSTLRRFDEPTKQMVLFQQTLS